MFKHVLANINIEILTKYSRSCFYTKGHVNSKEISTELICVIMSLHQLRILDSQVCTEPPLF